MRRDYTAASDATLVLLARDRDQAAFAELVTRHQGWLRSLLRRLARNHATADELAQQVLLRAWDGLPGLESAQLLPAWLKRIAVNVWLKQLQRKDALFRLDSDAAVPEESVDPGTSLGLDLDRALARLPEVCRLCVVLAYHEGMSHADVSALTGLPPGTVKSHVSRGSAQLRKYLAAYAPGGSSDD